MRLYLDAEVLQVLGKFSDNCFIDNKHRVSSIINASPVSNSPVKTRNSITIGDGRFSEPISNFISIISSSNDMKVKRRSNSANETCVNNLSTENLSSATRKMPQTHYEGYKL